MADKFEEGERVTRLRQALARTGLFPRFDFEIHDVERAGKVITGAVPWTAENQPEIRRAFDIANNWRDSHAYPMKSVRSQIIWHIRKNKLQGKTYARLKRMPAIRKKLGWIKHGLHQLQDLGGCRVILPTVEAVYQLVEAITKETRHIIRDPNIASPPKKTGYRSYHLLVTFRDKYPSSIHDGRHIEVQIRTWLQHSWATAVEAVGLFLGQDLKAGRGDPQWLRFFKLIAAEFAAAEGCPLPADVPDRPGRLAEIANLGSLFGVQQQCCRPMLHKPNLFRMRVPMSCRGRT